MNQFKKGDKVEIDSYYGTRYGVVIGYEEDELKREGFDIYWVEMDGQILPVDPYIGNMRFSKESE